MFEYIIILTYLLTIAIIVFGTYKLLQTMANKILKYQDTMQKGKSNQDILTIRIQAFERMTLFLERITPINLLLRITPIAQSALELQENLLLEIREEFNHNIAQQLYISSISWDQIVAAKNDIVTIINQSAAEVKPEEAAGLLAKTILAKIVASDVQPIDSALRILKSEFSKLFLVTHN